MVRSPIPWRRWFVAGCGLVACCGVIAATASACGVDLLGTLSTTAEGGPLADGGDGGACLGTRLENCSNGIDDDCNGKIDCADPACADHACVGRPPDWSFVTVAATAPGNSGGGDAGLEPATLDASCPNGWTAPRELVEAPRGGDDAGCACSCTDAGPNPCTQGGDAGEVTVRLRTDGTGACDDITSVISLDGGCQKLGFTWNGNINKVRAPERDVETVRCPAAAAKPAYVHDGVVALCVYGSDAGACGAAGESCVAKPGGAPICLVHEGEAPCPTGYGSRRVLVPRFGITDERSCECSCTSNASSCNNEELTFYTDTLCTAGARQVDLDDACNDLNGSGTPQSYRYQAEPNTTACSPVQATVPTEGGIKLPPSWTLCCP